MIEKYISKPAAYCSRAEHCVSELREKMTAWQIPAEFHDALIDYLVKEKYIDEQRYADAFVMDRFRFDHWGRVKLRMMLRAKGIDDDLITSSLDRIDEEVYRTLLARLVEQKRAKTKASSEREMRDKLLRWAVGRGFELDLVLRVLDNL